MGSLGIPFCLPPLTKEEESAASSTAGAGATAAAPDAAEEDNSEGDSSRGIPAAASSPEPSSSISPDRPDAGASATASPKVRSTRTRMVKSRPVFTPEDNAGKKPRGTNGGRKLRAAKILAAKKDGGGGGVGGAGTRRGRGRPRKGSDGRSRSDLRDLLEDEVAPQADGAGSDAHRKRSRNASDGENRWDRIRAKFKLLLQKMRRDTHFLQVYQQDGWRSSGREKLKPTAELKKAEDRVKAVKAELREVARRLTEMNSGGFRWGALQEDGEGNIEVDEIFCTKCNRGDSDDRDDILLCDFAGCFRSYHQNCLSPPITPSAFPDQEEDWFCWQCECLMDCLETLEDEFPGTSFASWEDVFPDTEAGAQGGAVGQGDPLQTESDDDDDDESFKASSSESEDDAGGKMRRSKAKSSNSSRSGSGSSDEGDGNGNRDENGSSSSSSGDSSDSDSDCDSEARWMSDAESVGSDELSKLHSEAGDLASFGEEAGDDGSKGPTRGASTAEGGRGDRARERRHKRNVALGLGDDDAVQRQREKSEIADALAGNGLMDTANIVESRTRRKKAVDYFKLNQAFFGDDSEDEDHVSSDEHDGESSEDSEGDLSDLSLSSTRETKKPKRNSIPSIDPATGQPRKRGRPRKVEAAASGEGAGAGAAVSIRTKMPKQPKRRKVPFIDPATGEKRKRGRPRKVVENGSQSDAAARDTAGKGKRGRPRKSKTSAANPEPSTLSKAEEQWAIARSATPYPPRNVTQNGAGNGYQTDEGEGPSFSPEDAEDVVVVDSDTDEVGAAGGMPAITYDVDDDTADVAAAAAAVAAEAAGEALGRSAAPTQSDRDWPPKGSTPGPASSVGSGGASLAWNGRA